MNRDLYGEYEIPSGPSFFSLRRNRELNGHADVPLAFTVPSHEDDPRWPKPLEGYMLGRHVYMVRSGKYATQVRGSQKELEELGFSFRLVDKAWAESIFPALEVFSAQYGHCDVWQDFVVPSEESWPKESWGLKPRLLRRHHKIWKVR